MTTPSLPSFTHAMTLRPITSGPDGPAFAADLNPHWTIGAKIHGGIMVALCAKAATAAVGGGSSTALQPLVVAANFLGAPDPGEVQLVTAVRKRGRRINVIDVELNQSGRTAVRAAVTVGVAESAGEPLLLANPVDVSVMPAEPPAGIEAIGPGHPMAEINHLAAGCDIRPDLTSVWTHEPGRSPVTRVWFQPRDEPVDALFAFVAGDISMPVTFAVGRTGWAPRCS